MKIAKGMKVVVVDNFGNEYEGVVENVSDYREPSMKYAVDIGWDDFVFVGENSIHPTEKGGDQVENIEKCEDISEQERLMLTIILGKIKNDLERVGDINKLLEGGSNG